MIAIPHGLAAEVLRALQDGPRTTWQIAYAIDRARGRGEEEPGVGLAPVWRALCDLRDCQVVAQDKSGFRFLCTWELRR